jgi:hypothetical protein
LRESEAFFAGGGQASGTVAEMLVVVGGIAVVFVVVVVIAATRRPRPLQMLRIPQSTGWDQLRVPAPVAPLLLLTPHTEDVAIRCYDARQHESGLRATCGVFENPTEADARIWLATRLMRDPVEVASSNTQAVTLGRFSAMARTSWIRLGDNGEPGRLVANINWYVPEDGTRRIHFVSTFVETTEGDGAVALITGLCRQIEFVRDEGRTIAVTELRGPPSVAPSLAEDHSTFG